MRHYTGLLGDQGPFAEKLADFTPRPQQQQLADVVGRALQRHGTLVAEAGTGTGKTFAYLAPALLSGRRVLISTGTRALQDQLFHRDLPTVRDVLGMPVKVALLKGRSNYLCRHRLNLTVNSETGLFESREQVHELQQIRDWANGAHSGDIAELAVVAENSSLWPQVTSTTDNCLGQECSEYGRCFVLEARRRAQEADIVVVNHHLLLADMLLKETGFGSLLPGVDAVIVDEAHQLPEIATQYFGTRVSSRQLTELLQDIRNEYRQAAGDMPDFEACLEAVFLLLTGLQRLLGPGSGRCEWRELQVHKQAQGQIEELLAALTRLQEGLDVLAERSRGLDNCRQRNQLARLRLQVFGVDDADGSQVRWIERHGRGFSLNLTPLDAAQRFQMCMQETACAWIFLSATLSINGGFDHFRERLGLTDTDELLLDSPFDYASHALLYLPADMPDVNAPMYTDAVIEAALPVIRASGGRAFVLFTSHRALQSAVARLRGELDFPILVQGDAPRRHLLDEFRALGNAVLLGTASFWEGVDVKGPALSVVVIDRLPFASPGDPVLKARLTALQQQGREPFMEYQLPQAVLALKQGMGRLIRDAADTGVLMLCDPRLTRKAYGKLFLASLPPMRRTRALHDVKDFLARTLAVHQRRMVAS